MARSETIILVIFANLVVRIIKYETIKSKYIYFPGVQKLWGAVPNASGGMQIISGGCAPPRKSVPGLCVYGRPGKIDKEMWQYAIAHILAL
jgi:hypothetical protein